MRVYKTKKLDEICYCETNGTSIFFDIRVKIPGSLLDNGFEAFSDTVKEDGIFFGLWGDEQKIPENIFIQCFNGKKDSDARPVEECGYAPYSYNKTKEYLDYIIGIDEYGEPITYTSNPDELSNYFGANPGLHII